MSVVRSSLKLDEIMRGLILCLEFL